MQRGPVPWLWVPSPPARRWCPNVVGAVAVVAMPKRIHTGGEVENLQLVGAAVVAATAPPVQEVSKARAVVSIGGVANATRVRANFSTSSPSRPSECHLPPRLSSVLAPLLFNRVLAPASPLAKCSTGVSSITSRAAFGRQPGPASIAKGERRFGFHHIKPALSVALPVLAANQ